jgi:hypothetical protein
MMTIPKAARCATGVSLAATLSLGLLTGCSGMASSGAYGSMLPDASGYAAPQPAGDAMPEAPAGVAPQESGGAMPPAPTGLLPQASAGVSPQAPADASPQESGDAMPEGPAGAAPPTPAATSPKTTAVPQSRIAQRIKGPFVRHVERRSRTGVHALQVHRSKRPLKASTSPHQHHHNAPRHDQRKPKT